MMQTMNGADSNRGRLRRFLPRLMIAFALLLSGAGAFAADDELPKVDPRVEGFYARDGKPAGMGVDAGSESLTWVLMLGLSIMCVAVLFKNARRTHLD